MPSNKLVGGGLILLLLLVTGCVSVQTTAFPIRTKRLPPKIAGTQILLFKESKPMRQYEPVAKLNIHIEKTFFIPSAFEEALPELEKLARNQGADALIEVDEKKSRLNETFIYNVTATAVTFTD